MRNRAFRHLAVIFSLLFLAAIPAQAGPIAYSDVVHVFSVRSNGQSSELRLRAVQQSGDTQASSPAFKLSAGTSLIQGPATSTAQRTSGSIETIAQEDITGTVCDCGEIRVPGGFPLWPLVGIPAICLTGICKTCTNPPCDTVCTTCECLGTCTTPTPEPASLLLLGSGLVALGAGARRRYTHTKLKRQDATATTEV